MKKIAAYIQSAAVYDLGYDERLDEAENIIIAFLDEYKEGVCRHYASAATMLFRTLGIPARYVEGYAVQTTAGEYVPITAMQGHAWVEVYVGGVGWMMVEVTGGSAGGAGGLGGSDHMNANEGVTLTQRLELEPNYAGKVFDGTPVLPDPNDLRGNALLAELLEKGYRYEAAVSGSQTEVGQSESVIEAFRLFDPDGRDVTALFEIELRTGILKVFPTEKSVVRVYLHQMQKYYDGTALVFPDGAYETIAIDSGVSLTLKLSISLTEVGRISLSAINGNIGSYASYTVKRNGADVTDGYLLEFVETENASASYAPLRVDPRRIEVTAQSATKIRDGIALSLNEAYVSLGTLAAGHRLYAHAKGEITEVGERPNEIVSVAVYDENGADVTDYYTVTVFSGILTVLPEEE